MIIAGGAVEAMVWMQPVAQQFFVGNLWSASDTDEMEMKFYML